VSFEFEMDWIMGQKEEVLGSKEGIIVGKREVPNVQ
jgi:hypothetical protein